jgi:hypothetical protein
MVHKCRLYSIRKHPGNMANLTWVAVWFLFNSEDVEHDHNILFLFITFFACKFCYQDLLAFFVSGIESTVVGVQNVYIKAHSCIDINKLFE